MIPEVFDLLLCLIVKTDPKTDYQHQNLKKTGIFINTAVAVMLSNKSNILYYAPRDKL